MGMATQGKEGRGTRLKRFLLTFLAAVLLYTCTPVGDSFWKWAGTASGFGDWQEGGLLEIHVIDVGKADAILLKSRGRAALLDAGKPVAGGAVADYLSRHGVEELDWLIMSHPDSDHIGGMAQVLWDIPVENFVQAAVTEEVEEHTPAFAQLQTALEKKAPNRMLLEPGQSFLLGDAMLTALGPAQDYGESNNNSLVLRLDCGGFTALFCGDMEREAEEGLLTSGLSLRADWLKVAHHGSKTSSTQSFLEAVSPRYAVISAGPDRNRLPREETLIRLEGIGAELYRTDTDGDLVFLYDGKTVSIKTEK